MMNPLDMLVIVFVAMSVISLAGLAIIYISKSEKVQKGLLYFLAVFGMVVAWMNAQMIPSYMTGELVIAWALGALSVVALLIQFCMKSENKFKIARILVTVSVVAGMLDAFMI